MRARRRGCSGYSPIAAAPDRASVPQAPRGGGDRLLQPAAMQAIELRRCAVTAAPAPDLVYMHEHTQAPDHGPDDWPTARPSGYSSAFSVHVRSRYAICTSSCSRHWPIWVASSSSSSRTVPSSRSPAYCGRTLSGKNGNRLTMTWRVTSGIGVEHFSSGDHAGEKRRASCGALPHPPVCCPDCLFETIDPPGRPIPGSKPESDLEFTSRPFRGRNKAEGVHRSWSPGWSGSPASGCTSGAPLIIQVRS